MARERTLDEALDEIDRWSAKLVARIKDLSSEELVEYFRKAERRHADRLNKPPKKKRKKAAKA